MRTGLDADRGLVQSLFRLKCESTRHEGGVIVPWQMGPPRWPNTHIGHGALSCRAVLEAGALLTWLMTGCAALWREKYWSIWGTT